MGIGGTGASLTNDPGGVLYCGASAVAVLADGTAGTYLKSGGTGAPSWDTPSAAQSQVFTSSGTFTVPAGVTTVFVTMVAGGGGGEDRGASTGGGGAGGQAYIQVPHTVTPSAGLTVTVGAKGTWSPGTSGTNGGDTSFDTLTVLGGHGGGQDGAGAGGLAQGTENLDASGSSGGTQSFKGGDGAAPPGNGGGGGASRFGDGGDGGAGAAASDGTGWGSGGGGNSANSDGADGTAGFVYVQW